MKLRLHLLLVFPCALLSLFAKSQDNAGINFSIVQPQDFSTKNYKVDTTLGAVIVADIGKSYFEVNNKGSFILIHEVKKRVKLIDKKGFGLATIYVQLFKSHSGGEEILDQVKASTYNLEEGKVTESKLSLQDVFKDKMNDNFLIKKFTLPALKEGSIIEYSYRIKSDFIFNLRSWAFQEQFPTLWSEYEVSIPQFFKYVALTRGYLPFHLKKNETKLTHYLIDPNDSRSFEITQKVTVPSDNVVSRWAVKNAPALREERYTSSLENHISAIEFQLAAIVYPNAPYRPIMGSWESVTEDLLKDRNFGEELSLSNRWISNEVAFSGKIAPTLEEATKIFKYVQANIKNKGSRGFYLSQTLKETLKNKSGYVADINLLLTLILDSKGFTAAPVLLSTRSNGVALELYPLLNRFNYVVCRLTINNVHYYLDASQPYLGFNKLPAYCYNGLARVINKTSEADYFLADSLTEIKSTSVILMLDPADSKNWMGMVQSKFGYNESSEARQKITESGTDVYLKNISEGFSDDMKVSDIELIDLDKPEEDLVVKYNIDINNSNSDIIYFSPLMREGLGDNPFKSQNRFYPVEMPYKINETYFLKMDIPSGYTIDEIPKSEKIMFNMDEGMFEYIVSRSDKEISIRSVIKLNRANFANEDYETLREFFGRIVKKQAEQIVLKKK